MTTEKRSRRAYLSRCAYLAVLLVSLPLAAAANPPWTVTIKRDTYGVPHVYASSTYGLYYGYGYAIAEDRMFQMEMIKRLVTGTVAEVLGEDYIGRDVESRSGFDSGSIRQQIAALDQEDRDILEGYAAGFNARIKEVLADRENLLPKQFIDFDFEPADWTAFDVAMLYVGTMAGRYSNSSSEIRNLALLQELQAELGDVAAKRMFDQIHWLEDTLAPTTVPRVPGVNSFAASDKAGKASKLAAQDEPAAKQKGASQLARLAPVSDHVLVAANAQEAAWRGVVTRDEWPVASNLWILGPTKTEDGSTMLQNGPQFGNFNPAYVWAVGLHGAGWDITGNTPLGLPVILFGTNGTIAWGATAGPLDVNDYYQLRLNPANPHEYLYNGVYRPMAKRTEVIEVRDADDLVLDVYSSVHGVVTSFDLANSSAYAFKRSWEGFEVQSLYGWIHSTRARNWEEWLAQAARVATTINWYYADFSGNIGYVSPGFLPIRAPHRDERLPAIGDGTMEWQGFRPFSEVPKVLNPAQGYVVNWNNRSAPGPAANDEGGGWSAADRVNEISARIEAKPLLSQDEVWDLIEQTSFADVNARYFMPYIAQATSGLTPADGPVYEVAQRLASWDMRAVPDGSGNFTDPAVTIFRAWLPLMIDKVVRDDLPMISTRVGTTRAGNNVQLLHNAFMGANAGVPQTFDFFNGASEAGKLAIVLEVLQETVAELTGEFGPDQSTWLSSYGPHRWGTEFFGVPIASPDERLEVEASMNRGTENDLITFGPHGVEMCTVTPPGQSGFVAPDGTKSPHYQDQLELYRDFECKPERLTKRAVNANLESVKTLSMPEKEPPGFSKGKGKGKGLGQGKGKGNR